MTTSGIKDFEWGKIAARHIERFEDETVSELAETAELPVLGAVRLEDRVYAADQHSDLMGSLKQLVEISRSIDSKLDGLLTRGQEPNVKTTARGKSGAKSATRRTTKRSASGKSAKA